MRKTTTQISMSVKCNKENGRQITNMIMVYENINTGHVCVCAAALNYHHAHVSTTKAKNMGALKKIIKMRDTMSDECAYYREMVARVS